MNIVIAYLDEIDVIRDGNWSLLMSALGQEQTFCTAAETGVSR